MRELARMHQQTFVTRARHETRSPVGRSVNAVQGLRERGAIPVNVKKRNERIARQGGARITVGIAGARGGAIPGLIH